MLYFYRFPAILGLLNAFMGEVPKRPELPANIDAIVKRGGRLRYGVWDQPSPDQQQTWRDAQDKKGEARNRATNDYHGLGEVRLGKKPHKGKGDGLSIREKQRSENNRKHP